MDRAARRRGDSPRSRQKHLIALVAVFGLVLAGAAAVAVILLSGGSDGTSADTGDDGRPLRTPSTGGTAGGPEPVLQGPVIRFAASQQEIGGGIQGVPSESRNLIPEIYADPSFGPFPNIDEGRVKVREWGYKEGHVGILQPDGLIAGVVEGRYYVRQELHLFDSPAGAIAAYDWYQELYRRKDGAEQVSARALGNRSAAWTWTSGTIENTDLERAFHHFVFRRGNLLVIVQTVGAETFMTIDPARDVAVIIDERALGNREAPTPTPSGQILPPTPVP